MTQALVVSKDGIDALGTAISNPNNVIFSSEYNTLKYYLSGTLALSINGNGGTQTVYGTVNHNLGYKPFFSVYANDPENIANYNVVPYNFSFITLLRYASTYVSTASMYFQYKANYNIGTNRTVTFYYKIFRNNLGL